MSKSTLLRPLALASLIANIGLVVTGAAVRLTGSGLGCPTWPRCTGTSYVTTPEMGVYGIIEFGNRLLGIALGLIAVATFVAALLHRPRRRSLTMLALAAGLGIPGQGVIGGITVLTDLNPWVVGLHFLLSMALIAVTYALWKRTTEGDRPRRSLAPAPIPALARLTATVSAAVIVLGVIVTGSGPHAGDADARRNGLDPATISQAHADVVFLLLGLSAGLWFALRAAKAPHQAIRAAAALIAIVLSQGLIGFVQYFTNLPPLLVGAHVLGACLVWVATLNTLWSLRERPSHEQGPNPTPAQPPATSPAPARVP